MRQLYRLLLDRLKALVLAGVGHDLEAEYLGQEAERRAELLRLARSYEEEGLTEVAKKLRGSVESLRPEQPVSRSVDIAQNLTEARSAPCELDQPDGGSHALTQRLTEAGLEQVEDRSSELNQEQTKEKTPSEAADSQDKHNQKRKPRTRKK